MESSGSSVGEFIDRHVGRYRADLERLVRIPSVSADGFDAAPVRESAESVASLLQAAGLQGVRLLELDGAHPYVTAHWSGRPGAPTVLLYAHHDVQPPGRTERWSTPPFKPVERDGRLYGRGSADDKAGILIHVAAVEAWLRTCGELPCNVKILIEGEEEIGSVHLDAFLARYAEELRADVMVLADAGNWSVGQPAITYSLRGLTEVTVRVRSLRAPQHSGMFGGLVPDPVLALARMLATLVDDGGDIAVPGLTDDVRPLTGAERARLDAIPFDASQYRRVAGMVEGAALTGNAVRGGWERLWMWPALTVIGLDAHPIHGSSNQVLAEAAARISMRLAPGQDPHRCQAVLSDHLKSVAPWGVQVEVEPGHDMAPAWVGVPEGPAFAAAEAALEEAFGVAPVYMGVGGTIPFVGPFSRAFGGIPALLTGPADPLSRIHSEDESLHLDDWRRHMHAEAGLLNRIARLVPPSA